MTGSGTNVDIQETNLPGVGLRHDFTTRAGRQLGVVTHRTGRRDLALMTLLGDGGTLVSFGSMTGEPMQLNSGDVIFKQATVKGFWGSKVSQAMAADDKRRLVGELLQLAARGGLSLPVDGVFGLDEVAAAAAASLEPGRNGKVLLRP